jgi:hypothetical protein
MATIVEESPLPVLAAGARRTIQQSTHGRSIVKFGWIDIRGLDEQLREAGVDAAVHSRVDGILDDRAEILYSHNYRPRCAESSWPRPAR